MLKLENPETLDISRALLAPAIRKSAAIAGLAALCIGAPSGPAVADGIASIKHMSISTQGMATGTVHVISTDGKTWNKIKSGSAQFAGQMKVDTKWPGYVDKVAVFLGKCSGHACDGSARIYAADTSARDFVKSETFGFNPTKLVSALIDGSAIYNHGKRIIDECNKGLQADGPTKERSFNQLIQLTLGANTGKALYKKNFQNEIGLVENPDHVAHGQVAIKVYCEPAAPPPESAEVRLPLKMTDLKLFLSTYSNAVSKPSIGLTCKKGQVLVRAKTNREGPVKLRLWTQVGKGPMQSQLIEVWSTSVGGGNYQAEFEKWISVSKNSVLKARVEDLITKPVGFHAGWKNLSLKCQSPGAGGFAQQQKPDSSAGKPNAGKQNGRVIKGNKAGGRKTKIGKRKPRPAVNRPDPGKALMKGLFPKRVQKNQRVRPARNTQTRPKPRKPQQRRIGNGRFMKKNR
ncbi:hypothetical protein [Hoeflea poritis]|uniref:Uncharacterized protein n=1 Tax=Hoeflea poritis TaxID=2993659 RepID=A0ABT4VTY5_9HYPH|nr:hypothetical protein [Hoeflea poritis]MDA4847448.1 hypothetical protein [Hoeflea poritis]